jgi:hypothetical protein
MVEFGKVYEVRIEKIQRNMPIRIVRSGEDGTFEGVALTPIPAPTPDGFRIPRGSSITGIEPKMVEGQPWPKSTDWDRTFLFRSERQVLRVEEERFRRLKRRSADASARAGGPRIAELDGRPGFRSEAWPPAFHDRRRAKQRAWVLYRRLILEYGQAPNIGFRIGIVLRLPPPSGKTIWAKSPIRLWVETLLARKFSCIRLTYRADLLGVKPTRGAVYELIHENPEICVGKLAKFLARFVRGDERSGT